MTTETLPVPGSAPETKVPVALPASDQPAVNPAPDQAQPVASAEGQPAPESKPGEDAAPKPKQTVSERIATIHAQKKQAEAEAQIARAELARVQAELQQIRQQPTDQMSWEDQQALQLRNIMKTEKYEDAHAAAKAKAQAVEQMRAVEYVTKLEESRERMPADFEAVYEAAKYLPLHDAALEVVMASDKAAELTYRLGKLPRLEVNRIASLPPHMQAAEIARIEARIETPSPRRHSNAPAPSPVVSGGSTVTAKDPANMTMEEYTKWRSGGKAA